MIEDRSLCTFYQRIGACRHGDKCSRKHIRPQLLKTVLLANLYSNPKTDRNSDISVSDNSAESFEHFYTDVYKRLARAGEIDSMLVCENENFHLNGNVYVKFCSPKAASEAVMLINQEWFAGKPVYCELLPVQNFHDAKCRAHDTNTCNRGDNCNFMHVKKISNDVTRKLRLAQDKSIALKRLRELFDDDSWGEQWVKPTREKYDRKRAKKEPAGAPTAQGAKDARTGNEKDAQSPVAEKASTENGEKDGDQTVNEGSESEQSALNTSQAQKENTEGDVSGEEETVSTTEAVARLFA